jgi:hypothetical protein
MLMILFIFPHRRVFLMVLVLVVGSRGIPLLPSRIIRSRLPRIHDIPPRLLTGWGVCPRRIQIRSLAITLVTSRDTQGTRDARGSLVSVRG